MLSKSRLTELEKLCAEATPGPWQQGTTLKTRQTSRWSLEEIQENERRERSFVFANFHVEDQGRSREYVANGRISHPEDAAFIAAARAAVPELIAEIRSLNRQIEIARKALEYCANTPTHPPTLNSINGTAKQALAEIEKINKGP